MWRAQTSIRWPARGGSLRPVGCARELGGVCAPAVCGVRAGDDHGRDDLRARSPWGARGWTTARLRVRERCAARRFEWLDWPDQAQFTALREELRSLGRHGDDAGRQPVTGHTTYGQALYLTRVVGLHMLHSRWDPATRHLLGPVVAGDGGPFPWRRGPDRRAGSRAGPGVADLSGLPAIGGSDAVGPARPEGSEPSAALLSPAHLARSRPAWRGPRGVA